MNSSNDPCLQEFVIHRCKITVIKPRQGTINLVRRDAGALAGQEGPTGTKGH